jgi:hypothetical protein
MATTNVGMTFAKTGLDPELIHGAALGEVIKKPKILLQKNVFLVKAFYILFCQFHGLIASAE